VSVSCESQNRPVYHSYENAVQAARDIASSPFLLDWTRLCGHERAEQRPDPSTLKIVENEYVWNPDQDPDAPKGQTLFLIEVYANMQERKREHELSVIAGELWQKRDPTFGEWEPIDKVWDTTVTVYRYDMVFAD